MVDQVRAIVQGLEAATERGIISLSLEIVRELKQVNPVDTGWSRANWVPALGTPRTTPAGTQPAKGQTVSDTAAQAAGEAQILSYKLQRGNVFISNNVPYITILNLRGAVYARNFYGDIAGPGFVQRAIADGVRAANNLTL